MKKTLLAIFLLFSLSANASEENKRIQVDRLLELTNVDSMMDQMYSQIMNMTKNIQKEKGITERELPLYEEHEKKVLALLKSEMGWNQMKGPLIELYLKHFTEIELIDMVAFYESETGQSILEKMPVVMQESMIIGQNLVVENLPKLEALSQEFAVKLSAFREEQRLLQESN